MNLAIDCAFQLLSTEPPERLSTLDTPSESAQVQEPLRSLTRLALEEDLKEDVGLKATRGVQLEEWFQLMRTLGTGSKPVQYMWCAAFAVLDADGSGFLSRSEFAKVSVHVYQQLPIT